MSASVVNLQTQVESVLGALVRAATVELTKLFESRYQASAVDVDVGLRQVKSEENDTFEKAGSVSTADTKRSIGVQVDGGIFPLWELSGPPLLSDGDCLREGKGEVSVVEECLIPSEILMAEDNGPVNLDWSPLKDPVLAEAMEMVEMGILETERPCDSDAQTEVVLHVCAETWTDGLGPGDTQSSPTKQKPLLILPDTSSVTSEEKVNFVCPLILKTESPTPKLESLKEPVQAEPQPACVSTAKGTAYSPSPFDGAATPVQVGVWERIPKEMNDDLHMKLKLASPDEKLMRPCAVQLVNVLTVPERDSGPEIKLQDDVANCKTATRLPKDLRRHQGPHTGHRLCCFTPCDDGIWRLQGVVTHSRDGYNCNKCGKTFKRRKILRRHERFHSGEKPYSCSVCSKTFALRKSLRRHVRFHTGEMPYNCMQCGKSFRLRDNLKAHLRFHTGEKPFSCVECGKTFRIMRNLQQHNLSQCGFFVPSFRTIAGK